MDSGEPPLTPPRTIPVVRHFQVRAARSRQPLLLVLAQNVLQLHFLLSKNDDELGQKYHHLHGPDSQDHAEASDAHEELGVVGVNLDDTDQDRQERDDKAKVVNAEGDVLGLGEGCDERIEEQRAKRA